MGCRIHGRKIHSQSLLLQQKPLAREPELFQSFSLQLNTVYTRVCSGKCVGDRSECPGAQSPRVAPQQVQHRMETVVTGDGSKLTLDQTLLPTFCLEGSVLANSTITK